jgi:hypothetical protein
MIAPGDWTSEKRVLSLSTIIASGDIEVILRSASREASSRCISRGTDFRIISISPEAPIVGTDDPRFLGASLALLTPFPVTALLVLMSVNWLAATILLCLSLERCLASERAATSDAFISAHTASRSADMFRETFLDFSSRYMVESDPVYLWFVWGMGENL